MWSNQRVLVCRRMVRTALTRQHSQDLNESPLRLVSAIGSSGSLHRLHFCTITQLSVVLTAEVFDGGGRAGSGSTEVVFVCADVRHSRSSKQSNSGGSTKELREDSGFSLPRRLFTGRPNSSSAARFVEIVSRC